ncbi:MAG: succinate dehydrogenase, cytochrome b556 subunit [Candidatus Zeuxoniibacter abyssi]|nr:MAG: succinate dehydrogenase, cytochrome b556 subunit [Candidatus Persebacteraceae bacterium AB1(2)]
MAGDRPKHLNLLQIRLPLPGVLSIFHRISGVLLILALPFFLGALQYSVKSQEGYDCVAQFFSHPLAKLVVWGAAWALFHHLCAGIRFLLLDLHIGVELAAARASAAAAFVVSIVLTVIFGVWLW